MRNLITSIAAIVLIALPGMARAECVSSELLAWVDNREANAISPARWQAVRNSLLGQDGGMPLADMQVIYNRRVSNGWAAGHWVPILSAMDCLEEAEEEEAKAQAEAEAQQPAPEPEPQAAPAQAEVQPVQDATPVQESTDDLSQPPASFIFFDDYEEMESGGEKWTQGGRRTHNEWIRPNGGTTNESHRAWNKWGPWDDLSADVRQGIHDSVGLDWVQLATDTYDSRRARQWETTPDFSTGRGGRYRWSGNFTHYVLHPGMAKAWSIADLPPKMVFEYNPGDRYAPWFAYVEYTRLDGRQFSADHWYGVKFDGGAIRATGNTGYDGLSAQWFSISPFHGDDYEDTPANMYLVGEVRRPKIIGTFVTDSGRSQ